jgi:hypothetical protein
MAPPRRDMDVVVRVPDRDPARPTDVAPGGDAGGGEQLPSDAGPLVHIASGRKAGLLRE